MYKHILIPTDGSDTADKAVVAGIDYARESGAKVTLFTAVPDYRLPNDSDIYSSRVVSVDEHNRRSEQKAHAVLAAAERRALSAGVAFDVDFAQSDHPFRAIIAAAQRHGCDAIFMATHARTGLAKLWHGSATEDVLSHSDIPTLVYR
jgi:nucleotide-binding universal stress UspA family protein